MKKVEVVRTAALERFSKTEGRENFSASNILLSVFSAVWETSHFYNLILILTNN